jgi:hypothetical protein
VRAQLGELRACSGEDEGRPGRAGNQVLDHVEQRRFGPVQVLDDEEGRARGGEGAQESGPGEAELLADRLRRETVERVVGQRDSGARRECERDPLGFAVRGRAVDVLANEAEELVGGDRARIVERDARRVPEDLAQRPVGDAIAVRPTASAVDGDVVRRTRPREELLRQPRLPDAGVA